jgi:hypothetical protein
MSDEELLRALRDVVARHTPPPQTQEFCQVLQSRDRWRIRILAGVTALLWLGGIVGMLYMVFWFNRFIILYSPHRPEPRSTLTADNELQRWYTTEEFHAKMELHHSLEACMVAIPLLLLAALGTVWLVFSSRQATLRQINFSLVALAQQLQEMRQTAQPVVPPVGKS